MILVRRVDLNEKIIRIKNWNSDTIDEASDTIWSYSLNSIILQLQFFSYYQFFAVFFVLSDKIGFKGN